jgi:uncharacterized surface protein with fasciclin (FAS1) repeats
MRKRLLVQVSALALLALVGFAVGAHQDEEEEPLYPLDEEYDESAVEEALDIVATATILGGLDIFVNAVDEADLGDLLRGEGSFTVFIPDDSAFAQLPEGQLDSLFADPAQLKALLSRHIVNGANVTFFDPETMTVKMLSGDEMTIRVDETRVTIGNAMVIDEEIWCSNGVIHVIDAVLAPVQTKK